jgi:diguanylate cyclase (GGDEF)-like protein/PAS domain S-box-containing protein
MSPDETFYKKLIDNLYDGVYFVDTNRIITYWNEASERITGYTRDQVVGRSCSENILNHCTELGDELCKNGCPLTATFVDGAQREADVFLHHADGHRVPVRVRVSPIRDENGVITGAVETFSDNADLFKTRRQMRQLEEVVTKDTLTGVGNRLFGEMRLKTALLQANLTNIPFGLLFIDLDGFKSVNDKYGHELGDRVLRMVANTLVTNLREKDAIIRWGGEEFLALMDVTDAGTLKRIAEKLRNLIEHSNLKMSAGIVGVTASVGATLAQNDDTLETLVARADRLMYASKQSGRNRVTLG